MVQIIQHHFQEGQLFYTRRDFASALASFEKCAELMPQLIEAWENIAVCMAELGKSKAEISLILLPQVGADIQQRLIEKINKLVIVPNKLSPYFEKLHAHETDEAIFLFGESLAANEVSDVESIAFLRALFLVHETMAKKQGVLYIASVLNDWMESPTVQHCLRLATEQTQSLISKYQKNSNINATADEVALLETVSIIHYTYGNYQNAALGFQCLVAFSDEPIKRQEYLKYLSTCLALAGKYEEALALDSGNITAWERLYPTQPEAFKARAKRLIYNANSINRQCLPYWPVRFVYFRDSEVCIAELTQASICGHDPMVFDEAFVYAGNRGNYRHAVPEPSIARVQTAVVVFSTNPNNYYHHLIEFGARLLAAAPHLNPDWPIYISSENIQPHQKLLTLLGVPNPIESFSVRESCQFETLYVVDIACPVHALPGPANLWDCYLSHPSSIQRLRETLLSAVNVSPSEGTRRFIYVRRLGNIRTFIDPDGQLESMLQVWADNHKFELLIFDGQCSFEQQIDLFASSQIIFGIHGAGLSNLIFTPPDCVVVELPIHNNSNTIFQELSAMIGRRHVLVADSCDYQGTIMIGESTLTLIRSALNQSLLS